MTSRNGIVQRLMQFRLLGHIPSAATTREHDLLYPNHASASAVPLVCAILTRSISECAGESMAQALAEIGDPQPVGNIKSKAGTSAKLMDMILVVILTVRKEFLVEYRAYESLAAAIMANHGATIERNVTVDSDPNRDTLREVHVVRFPDSDALNGYKADPKLLALAQIRERVVVATEVLTGEDGPDYGRFASPKILVPTDC